MAAWPNFWNKKLTLETDDSNARSCVQKAGVWATPAWLPQTDIEYLWQCISSMHEYNVQDCWGQTLKGILANGVQQSMQPMSSRGTFLMLT